MVNGRNLILCFKLFLDRMLYGIIRSIQSTIQHIYTNTLKIGVYILKGQTDRVLKIKIQDSSSQCCVEGTKVVAWKTEHVHSM